MTEENGQPQGTESPKEAVVPSGGFAPQAPVFTPKAAPPSETYYLPTIGDDTTPAEAEQIIEAIKTEAGADVKHPLTDAHHFQHGKWQTVWTRAHEIKASGGDGLSPITRACNEALAAQAEKQNVLIAEAQKEMDALVKLGFTADKIPDDVKDFQLRGLKEQRLHAEGEFEPLRLMLVKDAEVLRDFESIQILQNFQPTLIFDEDYIAEQLGEIILKIAKLNKQRYGGK